MSKNNEVECECGAIIKGTSKAHAESNLPKHKVSKRHKELMQIKLKNKKQNGNK